MTCCYCGKEFFHTTQYLSYRNDVCSQECADEVDDLTDDAADDLEMQFTEDYE